MADDNISVQFGAETGDLNAGVDEVKGKLGELGDTAPDLSEKFQEMGKTLLEAFAVDKVVEFMGRLAEMGEQIERTTKMTGLSTDQVQDFQYAVKMAGGDADAAGQSLLRFENNLAKQEGTGPAAAAYKALGISLVDAAGNAKPINQILAEVADQFSQTADGARKVEYATALGSRGFAQLIPVLDNGSQGLAELNNKLEELHGKQTPEAVEALAKMKQASNDLDAAWTELTSDIVSTFSSGKLTEGLATFVGKIHEAFDWVVKLDAAWKNWADNGSLAKLLGEGNFRDNPAVSSQKPQTVDFASFQGQEQYGPDQTKPELPALGDGAATADTSDQQLAREKVAFEEQMGKLRVAE